MREILFRAKRKNWRELTFSGGLMNENTQGNQRKD